jgi:hypothetical protein
LTIDGFEPVGTKASSAIVMSRLIIGPVVGVCLWLLATRVFELPADPAVWFVLLVESGTIVNRPRGPFFEHSCLS